MWWIEGCGRSVVYFNIYGGIEIEWSTTMYYHHRMGVLCSLGCCWLKCASKNNVISAARLAHKAVESCLKHVWMNLLQPLNCNYKCMGTDSNPGSKQHFALLIIFRRSMHGILHFLLFHDAEHLKTSQHSVTTMMNGSTWENFIRSIQ